MAIRGRGMLAAVGTAIGLAGCGGSGADLSSAVCADFVYQEDAQSAYRAGASQLDADKDGIACEDHPPQPPAPPVAPPPPEGRSPYDFMTALGTSIQLLAATGGYSIRYTDAIGGGGFAAFAAPFAIEGAIEVVSDLLAVRFFQTTDTTLLSWSPARNGFAAVTGVGVDATAPVPLSSIVGDYKLLGQRCSPVTFVCSIATATARIRGNGTLTLCLGTEYSDSCVDGDNRTLLPAVASDGTGTPMWTLGADGERLIASAVRATLALAFRDHRLDADGYPLTLDTFSLFGQRDTATSGVASPFTSMASFDMNGQLVLGLPAASEWRVMSNRPLAGFFQDAVGNTYLRSSTGQLVTWTAGSGLRHYSEP